MSEPYVRLEMVTPTDYVGGLMDLATGRRGEFKEMKYLTDTRTTLVFEIPLAEARCARGLPRSLKHLKPLATLQKQPPENHFPKKKPPQPSNPPPNPAHPIHPPNNPQQQHNQPGRHRLLRPAQVALQGLCVHGVQNN